MKSKRQGPKIHEGKELPISRIEYTLKYIEFLELGSNPFDPTTYCETI